MTHGDHTSPLYAVTVAACFLDVQAARHELPHERCLDDCMTLAHAYAMFGLDAEVRAAELAVVETRTGLGVGYSDREPVWRDGLLDGHTVVWLPDREAAGAGWLVDVTADQYPAIAALHSGPVVEAVGPSDPGRPERLVMRRGDSTISYTLAALPVTVEVLGHPAAVEQRHHHRRRGANVAAAILDLLNSHLGPDRLAQLSPRVAALASATAARQVHHTDNGDWRFGDADNDELLRLDELTLPAGVPPMGKVNAAAP